MRPSTSPGPRSEKQNLQQIERRGKKQILSLSSSFFCPLSLALSPWLHLKYRSESPRCDPLNTLFLPEGRGGKQRSPSALCLIKLIMCELLHKAAGPTSLSLPPSPSLSFFLHYHVCVCSSSTELNKSSFPFTSGMVQMGLTFSPQL